MDYKKKFTVVLPESLTDVLGIDEETVLETFFEDGKIKIRIIDDDGMENVYEDTNGTEIPEKCIECPHFCHECGVCTVNE